MEKHILSKSTFIRGNNCIKSLYLNKNHRNLRDKLSGQQEAIFEQGTEVGMLAQKLFPGGIDCSPENKFEFQKSVIKTKQEIDNGATVIYEAAFQFNSVLAALDILVKDGEGWKAYEVKSGTSVSETYELDATLQYYSIINSGIELKDISIIHLNAGYEKNGELDLKQLFTIISVKEKVLQNLPTIPEKVEKLKCILQEKNLPNVDIGPYCTTPYHCDFKGYCWKHIPEYSVFNISRLSTNAKFELYKKGVLDIKDVPDDFKLNESQRLQVKSEISGEKHFDAENINAFISSLNYPLYYLDFETFSTAVPIFDKSKPYQQLVSQYSVHIQTEKEGPLIHKEFLAETNGIDPRIQLIDNLIADCGEVGDIIVYNMEFESTRIQEMMSAFPEKAKALGKLNERLKDLMIPFQNKWYYAPDLQGSYSIKKVLPSLVPELSYKNLNIKEGGTALSVFTAMVKGEFKGNTEQTRKDLLEYCKLDTFAMVAIIDKLKILCQLEKLKNEFNVILDLDQIPEKNVKSSKPPIKSFISEYLSREERHYCSYLFSWLLNSPANRKHFFQLHENSTELLKNLSDDDFNNCRLYFEYTALRELIDLIGRKQHAREQKQKFKELIESVLFDKNSAVTKNGKDSQKKKPDIVFYFPVAKKLILVEAKFEMGFELDQIKQTLTYGEILKALFPEEIKEVAVSLIGLNYHLSFFAEKYSTKFTKNEIAQISWEIIAQKITSETIKEEIQKGIEYQKKIHPNFS